MKNYRAKYIKVAKGFKPLYAGKIATIDFTDERPICVYKNSKKK